MARSTSTQQVLTGELPDSFFQEEKPASDTRTEFIGTQNKIQVEKSVVSSNMDLRGSDCICSFWRFVSLVARREFRFLRFAPYHKSYMMVRSLLQPLFRPLRCVPRRASHKVRHFGFRLFCDTHRRAEDQRTRPGISFGHGGSPKM